MGLEIFRTDKTTKPSAYIALGPGLTTYSIFTATDNLLHRQRRQLVGQILTETSLRAFEPVVIQQVDILLANILHSAENSAPFDVSEQAQRLGFDIAGHLAFGYDLQLQTEERNRFMLNMVTKGSLWSSVFLQYPSMRKFSIGLLAVKSFRQLLGAYLGLVQRMIDARISERIDAKHDLYSRVAHALSQEGTGGIRDSELWAEANLFLTAGNNVHILAPPFKPSPRGLWIVNRIS
ncbi:cytochrome P450 [Xylariaceae sp. FL0255]|nr:cytochrome P450 [Xylariaceae sp. FL0255]